MSMCSLFLFMELPEKGITGIYKITNPKGRVYIGQSVYIERRFKTYKNLRCKDQPKLYYSFKKYGIDKHHFDIVTECKESELNDLERYYQELYNSVDNGLNCVYVQTKDRSGFLSQETKNKIGKAHKGKKMSDESRKKMSKTKKGKYIGLENHLSIKVICKNYKTKEVLEMGVCETAKYFKVDRELIFKRCNSLFVNPSKLKEWDFFYADKINEFKPINFGQSVIVLDKETGIYYYSIKELAEMLNIKQSTLVYKIKNRNINRYEITND